MSAHGVLLAVGVEPFAVFVTLVGGHRHDRAGKSPPAEGLKHVDRSHHVGGVSLHRLSIGKAHQRLRRQMEDKVRPCSGHRALNSRQIPNIAGLVVCNPARQLELLKQGRFGRRGERKPVDLRPEGEKPLAQPAALEPGVSGDKDAPVPEGF